MKFFTVQYDQPNTYQLNNYQITTTPSPLGISQQYQPANNPLYNNNMQQYPQSQFGRGAAPFNRAHPQHRQAYNHNGGFNTDPRQLHANRSPMSSNGALAPLSQFNNHNAMSNDEQYSPLHSTPASVYRSNVFNEQRPAFQQRPRGGFLA